MFIPDYILSNQHSCYNLQTSIHNHLMCPEQYLLPFMHFTHSTRCNCQVCYHSAHIIYISCHTHTPRKPHSRIENARASVRSCVPAQMSFTHRLSPFAHTHEAHEWRAPYTHNAPDVANAIENATATAWRAWLARAHTCNRDCYAITDYTNARLPPPPPPCSAHAHIHSQ